MTPWTTFFDALMAPRIQSEGPMVRMFRTEYSRDYNNAVRSNVRITEDYARSFVQRYHF
jgi:hypothetical protein